jgi:hypothetical protein
MLMTLCYYLNLQRDYRGHSHVLKNIVTFGSKINTSKTKIVIFSKNKIKNDYGFKIYDKIIDIQDSYS